MDRVLGMACTWGWAGTILADRGVSREKRLCVYAHAAHVIFIGKYGVSCLIMTCAWAKAESIWAA